MKFKPRGFSTKLHLKKISNDEVTESGIVLPTKPEYSDEMVSIYQIVHCDSSNKTVAELKLNQGDYVLMALASVFPLGKVVGVEDTGTDTYIADAMDVFEPLTKID